MSAEATARSAVTERVAWVDLARGIGIFLVVFGHTLRGLVSGGVLPKTGWPAALDTWIYSFHMPLFFALSGLFAPRLARKSWSAVLSDRARGIVYPYVVWSTLQTLFQIALSRYTNKPADAASLVGIVVRPVMQFWFLYALLLISLFYVALVKAKLPAWALIAVAVVLLFVPDFGLVGVLPPILGFKSFFIYYVAGALCAKLVAYQPSRAASSSVALFGFCAVTVAVTHFGEPPSVVLKVLVALLGMSAVASLSASLPAKGFAFLKRWGTYSLQIFVAHTLASAGVRIVLQRGAHVSSPVVHLIGGTLAGITFPLLLALLCERRGWDFVFTLRAKPALRPVHADRSAS